MNQNKKYVVYWQEWEDINILGYLEEDELSDEIKAVLKAFGYCVEELGKYDISELYQNNIKAVEKIKEGKSFFTAQILEDKEYLVERKYLGVSIPDKKFTDKDVNYEIIHIGERSVQKYITFKVWAKDVDEAYDIIKREVGNLRQQGLI